MVETFQDFFLPSIIFILYKCLSLARNLEFHALELYVFSTGPIGFDFIMHPNFKLSSSEMIKLYFSQSLVPYIGKQYIL